jgi:hypothetical protein
LSREGCRRDECECDEGCAEQSGVHHGCVPFDLPSKLRSALMEPLQRESLKTTPHDSSDAAYLNREICCGHHEIFRRTLIGF